MRQWKLVVCNMKIQGAKKRRAKWPTKIQVWKLKEEKVQKEYEIKMKDADMNSYEFCK
jgi:hypothetical protein